MKLTSHPLAPYNRHAIWLFVCCILLLLPSQVFAGQNRNEDYLDIYREELDLGRSYLAAGKNELAEEVLFELQTCLSEFLPARHGLFLKTRLALAESIERQRKFEIAQKQFQELLTIAQEDGLADLEARTYIQLALIYEQTGAHDLCYDYLLRAKRVVAEHQLSARIPQLAVRLASYYRFVPQMDSALHYATLAADFGETINEAGDQSVHIADGYLLQGMLVSPDDIEGTERAVERASHYYNKVGNHFYGVAVLFNLTGRALRTKRTRSALNYNDQAFAIADNIVDRSSEYYKLISGLYDFRSRIYANLGQQDSSFHYLELKAAADLQVSEQYSREKILELELKFDRERKGLQIAKQQAQLDRERQWRISLSVGLAILVGSGAVLLFLYRRLQQAKREVERLAETAIKTNVSLEASLQEQIMLQGELHHRVKNNLQIIISLLEMQSDDIQDDSARERLHIMGERIHSMAAIHEILYTREGVSNASFPEYVHRLCRHFMQLSSPANSPCFHFDLEEVWFDLETLMPVGIILNELLTNTRKYASVPERETQIYISLTSQNGRFRLNYRDNGPGFPNATLKSREGGLGTYLLDSMSRQLGGKVRTYNDGGAVVELTFRAVRQPGKQASGQVGGYHSEQERYHSEHQVQLG